MLVEVIAPKSRNIPWIVTLDGQKQSENNKIRRVSIDKFYDIVTGVNNSFSELCKVLPLVISDVIAQNGSKTKQNTVLKELNNISKDLTTSLFLLAFQRYDGFCNFELKKND